MTHDRSMKERIAEKVLTDTDLVGRVIEEFSLELRKELDGYKGINGDYLGEQLRWDIGARAFFHLLGFLDAFAGKYDWEPGLAREYIFRLYSENEWKPFADEYMPGSAASDQSSFVQLEALEGFISTASACGMTLMENAAYVQRELPNVNLPLEIQADVESLCSELIGTKHDVFHELGELKECANLEDRVRRIMWWISEAVVKLREMVERLDALAKSDSRYGTAYLLVAESGTNILKSFVPAGRSAGRLLDAD
jgi:hypothetical protein